MDVHVVTVPDVWQLPDDPARLEVAAARMRRRAAELEATGALLRHGQRSLNQLLERIEVPMAWEPGRLTFYPTDPRDLAAIEAARRAAAEIHAALRRATNPPPSNAPTQELPILRPRRS